ncbi:MAG: tetratricopeptide repeat protein [Myxococcota bacterium]
MTRTSAAATEPPRSGQRVGRYTLVEPLPDEGRGREILARESLGLGGTRDVVLTLYASVAEAAAVARTALTLAHPALLSVLDAGSEGELHFVARPRLPALGGASVAALAQHGGIPPSLADRITADVADFAAAAHAAGTTHGSLGAACLLLSLEGAVRLVPFAGAPAGAAALRQDLDALLALHRSFGGTKTPTRPAHAAALAQALRARLGPGEAGTSAGLAGLLEGLAARPSRLLGVLTRSERTPLLGRDAVLDRLRVDLADGGLRVIAAAAGVGKTRLLEAYVASLPAEAPRLWLSVGASDAAGALGHALGVTGGARAQREEAIGQALAARAATTVVFDDAAAPLPALLASLARWRRAAPAVRFLVATREAYEGPDALRLEGLEEQDALALLATLAGPARDEDARRAIANALGGNPLALELAAKRLPLLGAEALLARLGEDDAPRGAVTTALEASWNGLTPTQRHALAQLSTFAGAFDVEAAEAVVEVEGAAEREAVVDVLAELQARSLVLTDEADAGITLLLPSPVRSFAAARLAPESGAPHRHRAFTLARIRDAGPGALERAQGDLVRGALAPGATEERAAVLLALFPLARTEDVGGLAEAIKAVLALPMESQTRAGLLRLRAALTARAGALQDAGDDLVAALDLADGPARLALLLDRAELEQTAGALDAAEGTLRDAEALAAQASLEANRAEALARLHRGKGLLAHARGALDAAWDDYARAQAIAEERQDHRTRGEMRQLLGTLRLQQGRLDEAESHLEEALALHRAHGLRALAGGVLGNLGILAQERGAREVARARYDEALAMLRAVGERLLVAHVLGYRANLAQEVGEPDEAATAYDEALGILRDIGDPRLAGVFLAGLGGLEAGRGRRDEAEAAFGKAETQLRAVGDPALLAALDVHRAQAEVFRYDQARNAGDAAGAEAAFAAAESVLATVPEGMRSDDLRFALRVLGAALGRRALRVAEDGAWFAPPGGTAVTLGRREAPRRMLAALAGARLEGTVLDAEALLAAGWPGERMAAQSASNRVHVALSALRKLGLKPFIVRQEEGWTLAPAVPLRREA